MSGSVAGCEAPRDGPAPTCGRADPRSGHRLWRRVVLFPLTRLGVALLVLVIALIARDVLVNPVLRLPPDAVAARAIVTVLAVLGGYVAYVRIVERRGASELALAYAPRELAAGVAVGAAMIGIVVGTLGALGYYRAEGFGPWSLLLVPAVATASTAVVEEILFRGVLFRIAEEALGTWTALIVSGGAFGLLHLGNDHASLVAVVSIAAVGGVFLAATYILTRRLWLAIGVHYAVNLVQGAVFGLPVSGRERQGILQGVLDGPALLTGGAFGIEASLVTAGLGVVVSGYVIRRAYAGGCFVGPVWRRGSGLRNGGILATSSADVAGAAAPEPDLDAAPFSREEP